MLSDSNHEAQRDEIELLKNILFEQMTLVEEEPHFVVEIDITPDVIDDPKLKFKVRFSLPHEYPDSGLNLEVNDLSNYLASFKIKAMVEKIREFEQENLGMPMMYQMYEMVKDFANEQEEVMHNEALNKLTLEEEKKKKYEEKIKAIEKQLIETRTFTPVTKDNFETWFKKFYADQNKGKEKKIEQDQRMSGREYFMNMKNLKAGEVFNDGIEDAGEEEEEESKENNGENAVFFDAEAFEENIDDIDFDQEYVDDT